MKLKFLGTGTSQGIPIIGCDCEICTSNDLKNKRFRSSVLITTDDEKKILIDCGPDFRQQMLANKEKNVDTILITHEHNDHMIGLDDMRPILFRKEKREVPIYCQNRVGNDLKLRFAYAFAENKYPGAPSFALNIIDKEIFTIGNTEIQPITVFHGKLPILGYKINKMAYITDASFISDEEKEKLKDLDILILNCLRDERSHHSHFILPEVIKLNEELRPERIFLTHISHCFKINKMNDLPTNMVIAYDGLEINF